MHYYRVLKLLAILITITISLIPFGEWLKAAPWGESMSRIRMPLQPLPSPMTTASLKNLRGVQVFGFGRTNYELENTPPVASRGELELESTNLVESNSSSGVRKRKTVTPSVFKNRRNNNGQKVGESNGRPSKKAQIDDSEDFVDVPVAPAVPPHRTQ